MIVWGCCLRSSTALGFGSVLLMFGGCGGGRAVHFAIGLIPFAERRGVQSDHLLLRVIDRLGSCCGGDLSFRSVHFLDM